MAPRKPPICPVNPKHGQMRVTYFCAQCKAEWGKSGGRKRARVLSPRERTEIAKRASKVAVQLRQKRTKD